MHTGIIRASISVFALLFAIGCGAAAAADRSSTPQHQWTEADWYAEAVDQAFVSYATDVAEATSVQCRSQAEADALAESLAHGRFESHLSAALAQYGLTIHGLQVYGHDHPAFVEAQVAVNEPRMERLLQAAARITLVRAPGATPVEFESAEIVEGDEARLASSR